LLRRFRTLAALLLAALLLGACGSGATSVQDGPAASTEVNIGGAVIMAELALTPDARAQGLSDRDAIPQQAGMLFVLEALRTPSFTMSGMRFPLDFVWISEEKEVVSVTENVQPVDGEGQVVSNLQPPQPVAFVLEVNAGTVARLGIERGQSVTFKPDLTLEDAS
jgi:uncharacterized membrane protein (UPF0127 family)